MGKTKLEVENVRPVIEFLKDLLVDGAVQKDGVKILSPDRKIKLCIQLDKNNDIIVLVDGIKLKIDMYVEVDTNLLSLTIDENEVIPSLQLIPKFLTPKIKVIS